MFVCLYKNIRQVFIGLLQCDVNVPQEARMVSFVVVVVVANLIQT